MTICTCCGLMDPGGLDIQVCVYFRVHGIALHCMICLPEMGGRKGYNCQP